MLRAAVDARLDVVALTDHDTTAGWAEAAAAVPSGLTLIRGAELSCVWWPADRDQPPISLHLLAYLFDPAEPRLRAERLRVREGRVGRARTMVERMVADGHDMRWDDVAEEAGGGPVGRPHVARAMVRRGLVSTMDEAFTAAWIGAGGRYRVAKPDTNVLTAIELVRAAGGVPVFARIPWPPSVGCWCPMVRTRCSPRRAWAALRRTTSTMNRRLGRRSGRSPPSWGFSSPAPAISTVPTKRSRSVPRRPSRRRTNGCCPRRPVSNR
ncbi:PHP domain-containing protein [Fodinicola feengrottensis]|uniref:PHP domain-containing protein n=1 Tax=Fodinicola feengrottensis TaxID=435914 RepID=UPI0028BE94C1|nr:hypothetical protein [Fodinicola feengrottensis]